jgi:hypothetical protein
MWMLDEGVDSSNYQNQKNQALSRIKNREKTGLSFQLPTPLTVTQIEP